MNKLYLDFNATTPIDREVSDAMKPFLTNLFGNPSSQHAFGIDAKLAIEKARKQVSTLINAKPYEIIFTSGATESNNLAILGYLKPYSNSKKHIITSKIEHPSVIEVFKHLKNNGFTVDFVDVDEFGIIDLNQLIDTINPSTVLISIMHANNEVGSIQPIKKISKIARQNNIVFHVDAAQSLGKIEVDVNELGVDLLSVAGHKLYAPKGIGALFIRQGIHIENMFFGADHEQGLRAGTENIMQIAGLGKACEIAKEHLKTFSDNMQKTRDLLHTKLNEEVPDIKLNGHPEFRLPNTLSISFKGLEANTILSELENVAASAGAACHTDEIEISGVLEAMNVPVEYAMGTIRFSTGRTTSTEEIELAAKEITTLVNKLRLPQIKESEIEITNIKLTQFTHGLGCACKMRPQDLECILAKVPKFQNPNILVDIETNDDSTVYKINNETALVQTVDFFTPVVDKPYDFGAIAAANAISDIYAMGAKPAFALNIVGFPSKRLPQKILEEILKGASDKASEAGIPVLGGHTIDDNEPKYGMAVSGFVHPDKILRNTGAKIGDSIILTKPIGTGILTTALKRGLLDEITSQKIIKLMSELNAKAATIMENFPVSACTDVTGFGLLGHLREVILASKITCSISFNKVPIIDKTIDFASIGIIPGGSKNNLAYVSEDLIWDDNFNDFEKIILADAQTSGGLLIFIHDKYSEKLLQSLQETGITDAAIIGKVTSDKNTKIMISR